MTKQDQWFLEKDFTEVAKAINDLQKQIDNLEIKISDLYMKQQQVSVEPVVKPACFDWQKERPTKACVFMTRVWNKSLGIYDYNIWRFEKVDCDGSWYLGWLTEDGEEWDDIKDCNFDEYCIIESKSV